MAPNLGSFGIVVGFPVNIIRDIFEGYEMLDTANSYDDKVAIIRMIVGEESGRVANVFKSMMNADN